MGSDVPPWHGPDNRAGKVSQEDGSKREKEQVIVRDTLEYVAGDNA